jgi:hypothetical protein
MTDSAASGPSRTGAIARVHVVLPGLTARQWICGGLLIARRLAELLAAHIETQVVTSADREDGVPFLDDVLTQASERDLFLITWGPHVTDLLARLHGRQVAYYAQSTGWGSVVPPTVPVISLSRFIMASWMHQAPTNPLFLLGPVVGPDCRDEGAPRDIEVLFLARKSTPYLAERLVPALRERVHVHTVRDFIPHAELVSLYKRSRVYLYSSAPWDSGWVEGFGLQPLEAMLCGCAVFSNLHGGLSDYLDPEVNAYKLEVHSLAYDVSRIVHAVANGAPASSHEIAHLREVYSEAAFHDRARRILSALDDFFSRTAGVPPDIATKKPTPRQTGPLSRIRTALHPARLAARVRR